MSYNEDNAVAFQDLIADLLVETRNWQRGETVKEGVLMTLPDGGTRLLVTRNWHWPVCDTDYARNAAQYATHHGHARGGAVLAVMSTFGELGKAYVEPSLAHNLEVLEEPHIAAMAGRRGVDALERYARILRDQGYGRDMLPRDRWAKPASTLPHEKLRFTAQDVKTVRDAYGLSMPDAKTVVVKERLRGAIAHLRTDRDFDLLVEVVATLVENASIRS